MSFKRELFIQLCFITVTYQQHGNDRENARQLPQRLNQLIINYNERSAFKINEVTEIRSKYEISPHFELGYVVSEILERYRKMVILALKPIEYISDIVFDTLKQTELIQQLFLEIYHLVNMAHEIVSKYSNVKEYSDKQQFDRVTIEEHNLKIKENERQRERERKKRMKHMNKQRKLYLKGMALFGPKTTKKPSKWWPIDYGWEIDYYW